MRILILEDDPKRWVAFKRNLIGNEVMIVDQTDQAIDLLKSQYWDALFLDHDLGGKVYCESGPGTGWEVAEWLSKNEDLAPKVVITHSLHDVGRANICKVFPKAVEAPFLWTNPKVVLDNFY
jgi:CheY-like chemotaxis protein